MKNAPPKNPLDYQGFSIRVTFNAIDEQGFDTFLDDLIEKVVSEGCVVGGGGSHQTGFEGVITKKGLRESTTEAQRESVEAWLEERSEVAKAEVSESWDTSEDGSVTAGEKF
jgi:uncharacterized protein YggL (DUF469 family)